VCKCYTEEQADSLLAVLKDEPIKPAIILGLFYGLRRSEVLGLRWQDIDFDKGVMHIRNTVVRMKTLIEAKQTKSNASKRTPFIIPETKPYLLRLKRCQSEKRLLAGSSYIINDHVAYGTTGNSLRRIIYPTDSNTSLTKTDCHQFDSMSCGIRPEASCFKKVYRPNTSKSISATNKFPRR